MKALIWIGCMVLNYIIQSIARIVVYCIPATDDSSILVIGLLSGLLSAASIGFCIWLAITLCKKWDWYNVLKKAAEANMTVSEYGRKGLSEEFLAKLEELSNTIFYDDLKDALKKCVKKGKITKEQYIILLKEYTAEKK